MQKLVFSALIVTAIGVVFAGVKNYEFVWKDYENVPAAADEGAEPASAWSLVDAWSPKEGEAYIPVARSVWTLESLVAGEPAAQKAGADPTIFHATNLAFHAAAAILVFLILASCVEYPAAAFLGALLFALHPLQVEAVGWISGLPYVMGSFFGLAAVWQYLHYGRKKDEESGFRRRNPTRHYVAALIFFALAVLSFPGAAMVPLIGFVVIRLIPAKNSFAKPKTPFWPLGVWLFLAAPLILWNVVLIHSGMVYHDLSIWSRPLVAADAFGFYLYKLFFPLQIGPDYGRSPGFVMSHWWAYFTWLAPATILLAVSYWRGKSRQWLAAAAGIFFLALLPFLGLIPFESQSASTVANRFAYLAMIGPALGVAYLVTHARHAVIPVAAIGFVIGCGWLSQDQIQHWKSDTALWERALAVNPKSPRAHEVLADRYRRAGKWDKAQVHYENVLETHPSTPEPFYYLAEIEREKSHPKKAIPLYRRVLALDPGFSGAHLGLARAYFETGQTEKSRDHFLKVIKADPESGIAFHYLGRTYTDEQAYAEAAPVLRESLRHLDAERETLTARSHALLGVSLAEMGRAPEAKSHLENALALAPEDAPSHKILGDLLVAENEYAKALPHYRQAAEQIDDDPELYRNLGVVLSSQEQYTAAARSFEKSLELDPDSPTAHEMLGIAYYHLRKFDKADQHLKKALELKPRSAEAHYYRSDIDRWHGQVSAALAGYYKALKIDPNHALSHYRLGNWFMEDGQPRQAIWHYRKALERQPDNSRVAARLQSAKNRLE